MTTLDRDSQTVTRSKPTPSLREARVARIIADRDRQRWAERGIEHLWHELVRSDAT